MTSPCSPSVRVRMAEPTIIYSLESDECSRYTADFYRSLAESYLINSSHISKYSYVPKIKIFYTIAASVLEHTIYSDIVFIFSEHFSLIFASYGGGIRICDLLV